MDVFESTTQVADKLGILRNSLIRIINRHPELKPENKLLPSGDLLWAQADIDRVIEFKNTRNKVGRPRKQKVEKQADDGQADKIVGRP